MNFLKERVAYLKGLAEGMQLNDTTNEGKLLKAVIDVLDDVALVVDDLEDTQEQLSEQVEEISEDLADIESIVYGEECDEDYDGDDDTDGDWCDDSEPEGEFECPHCGKTVYLKDAYMKKDSILCPHCHREIEIEWEFENEEDDDDGDSEDGQED